MPRVVIELLAGPGVSPTVLLDAGFRPGDTVEISSIDQSSVTRNLTPQQIAVLRLLNAQPCTARYVGDNLEDWTGRGKVGYDVAHAVLNRLYNRDLVSRDGRPAKYTITELGKQALDNA